MEVIYWYALFAFTTGVASVYEIYLPIIAEVKRTHPGDNLLRYKGWGLVAWFCMAVIAAPVVATVALVPAFSHIFIDTVSRVAVQD